MLDFFFENQVLIIIITMVIALASQGFIQASFAKYSKVDSKTNLTGKEVAEKILSRNGIMDVKVQRIEQTLGDHYDPSKKQVSLSPHVYESSSVAAISVAAHEVGHAIQHHEGSVFLKFRTAIFPLAALGSRGAWIAIFIGLIAQISGLFYLGIIFLGFTLAFQVATLPVEFDASARAIKQLTDLGYVRSETITGAKKVLTSAALTYVAAVVTSILTILRLLSLVRRD